jgi:hypothetical protein
MWWTGGASWGIETMNDATGNLSQSPLAAASWGPGRLDIIYNSNSAAKRLSYEGWWGKAMPVLPNVSSIGDAVARHSGNEDLLDYLYYNFASHNFEHAVARR